MDEELSGQDVDPRDEEFEAEMFLNFRRFRELLESVRSLDAELCSIAERRAEVMGSNHESVVEVARLDSQAAEVRERRIRQCIILDGIPCPRGHTGVCWSEAEDVWCAVCEFVRRSEDAMVNHEVEE
jgi:hypothetical protein